MTNEMMTKGLQDYGGNMKNSYEIAGKPVTHNQFISFLKGCGGGDDF